MSASPMARQVTDTRAIPIKRVLLNDPSELPSHYSQTPGGTLFSTTPGGTKIVYEKNFLMNLRNSPISRTPPIAEIPENLLRGANSPPKKYNNNNNYYNNNKKRNSIGGQRRNSSSTDNKKSWREEEDNNQFQMDL